jgi:hypothetical protein
VLERGRRAGGIRGLRELVPADVGVGAYLRLDRDWREGGATRTRLREYIDAGMREVHLYHLGLLGREGLRTLGRVVDSTRELAGH